MDIYKKEPAKVESLIEQLCKYLVEDPQNKGKYFLCS